VNIERLKREEAILSSLQRFDYLSRSQLQQLHDLAGDRNARRVLSEMSEFISCFRYETGENVYYLTKAGRERIGGGKPRQKTAQVSHFLMRNDVYIHFRPAEWRNEVKAAIGNVSVIADAYFKFQNRLHFLEIDRLQHMAKNKEKINRYKELHATGVYQEKFRYFPRLMWVTLTEGRKRQLVECCEGLDAQVYVWEEIREGTT
jgi:hypothetical protein